MGVHQTSMKCYHIHPQGGGRGGGGQGSIRDVKEDIQSKCTVIQIQLQPKGIPTEALQEQPIPNPVPTIWVVINTAVLRTQARPEGTPLLTHMCAQVPMHTHISSYACGGPKLMSGISLERLHSASLTSQLGPEISLVLEFLTIPQAT